jgi:hypothetical protein
MACGTNIVPGYKEFNNKMKEVARDPALETKVNQLMSRSVPKKFKKQMKT